MRSPAATQPGFSVLGSVLTRVSQMAVVLVQGICAGTLAFSMVGGNSNTICEMNQKVLCMKKMPSRWVLFWAVLSVGCTIGALLLGPWVLPPLQAEQERFRGLMEAGIGLLRLGLAAGAVLALLSLAFWRRGESVLQEPQAQPATRAGTKLLALLLMVIVVVLAVTRLDTTLWWDELSTLTRVVKRGPVVILTFSCDANNHILNSLLTWASIRAISEHETALHLSPFLFSIAAVQLLFWTLVRAAGTRVAFLSGLVAATHPWLINHSVEARGYAGAILFSWASIIVFARMITQGSPRQTALYIACCVTAFGFITTTILIPFAHGLVACFLLLAGYRFRDLARYRANAINSIFACLWVPVVAILMFGFPLPQTLAYARTGAIKDHLPLGWALGREMLTYVTGLEELVPAAIFAGLACLGGWAAFRSGSLRFLRMLMVSSLVPFGVAVLYVLLPGIHSSARFFCFLILPVCCCIGLAVDWLARMRTVGRIAAGLVVASWLGLLALEHQRLLVINQPNLKVLAAELHGKRVVLIGAQADMNIYYFTQATSYQEDKSQMTLQEALAGAEVVVEGRAGKDNKLEEPDVAIIALGFHLQQMLPSAIPGRTEYLVYSRAAR